MLNFEAVFLKTNSGQLLPRTEGYDVTTFEFPSQKKEGKGGWEPSFASNLILNFRVLIRPYWPGQVQSHIKDIQIDLQYKNQNVRGRKALNKGQILILCTVRNIEERRHATYYLTLSGAEVKVQFLPNELNFSCSRS